MKVLPFFICFIYILALNEVYGQFTMHYDEISDNEILLNEKGDIILSTGNFYFSRITPKGEVLWTKKLFNETTNSLSASFPENMLITDECEFTRFRRSYSNLTDNNSYLISFLDGEGQVKWTKSIQLDFESNQINQQYAASAILFQNQIFVSINLFHHGINDDVLSILSLDLNGNFVEHKTFIRLGNSISTPKTSFHRLGDNFLGVLTSSEEIIEGEEESEIVIFNSKLEQEYSFKVGMTIQNIYFENDNFYLLGYQGANRSPKFISLDSNLETVWTLELRKFVFESISSRFGKVDDGIMVKTRVPSERSEIISRVSNTGELISSHRIPREYFVQDFKFATNSNNIAYNSRAESLHENPWTNLLSYYNIEFDNLNCYIPQTCIETDSFEFDLNIIEKPYSLIELPILIKDTLFSTRDVSLGSEAICSDNFGTVAVPLFSSDDTLCIGEPVPLYNLQNYTAQSVHWELPGSTLDNSNENDPSFAYTEEGRYTITQIVEYANCFSDYSIEVIVVNPAITKFDIDQILCESKDYRFDVSTEDAISYLWLADSSTLPTFLASMPGLYKVQITDSHCVQYQTLSLSYFDYNLIKVELNSDTTICTQKPISLSLTIDSLVSFSWDDFEPELNRELSESGSYTLTTSLGECSTSNLINIIAEDCSTQIYIPNAFSPNSDGVNDSFFPIGNYFEVLDFNVFDRWGNQLHNSQNPWNGAFRGQDVSPGVYLYYLKIKNTILDESEILKGDVIIVK